MIEDLDLAEYEALARRHKGSDHWPDPTSASIMASNYPATFLHLIQIARTEGAAAMKPQPHGNA